MLDHSNPRPEGYMRILKQVIYSYCQWCDVFLDCSLTWCGEALYGAVGASGAGQGLAGRALPRTDVSFWAGLRANGPAGAPPGGVGLAVQPGRAGETLPLARNFLEPAWTHRKPCDRKSGSRK